MAQAVRCGKPIIVLRDSKYKFLEQDIPDSWSVFKLLFMGPRTLVCSVRFITACAERLKDIRLNPRKKDVMMKFYKKEDTGNSTL